MIQKHKNNELKSDEIYELLETIIVRSLPDDREAFFATGNLLIQYAIAGTPPEEIGKKTRLNNEFGESVITTLEMAMLIWGTISALREIYITLDDIINPQDKKLLLAKWKKELEDAGLSSDIAAKIAEQHGKEFLNRLK